MRIKKTKTLVHLVGQVKHARRMYAEATTPEDRLVCQKATLAYHESIEDLIPADEITDRAVRHLVAAAITHGEAHNVVTRCGARLVKDLASAWVVEFWT
jgi:hypothetical protein